MPNEDRRRGEPCGGWGEHPLRWEGAYDKKGNDKRGLRGAMGGYVREGSGGGMTNDG
jgi:hypothetical protein